MFPYQRKMNWELKNAYYSLRRRPTHNVLLHRISIWVLIGQFAIYMMQYLPL